MTDRLTRRDWGGRELDPRTPALVYTGDSRLDYHVDFDRMLTAAEVLFWVVQVSEKPWGSPALTGFVEAVNEILSPQSNLRTSNQACTPERVREQIKAFVAVPR